MLNKSQLDNYDDKELLLTNGVKFKRKSRFGLLHTSVY